VIEEINEKELEMLGRVADSGSPEIDEKILKDLLVQSAGEQTPFNLPLHS